MQLYQVPLLQVRSRRPVRVMNNSTCCCGTSAEVMHEEPLGFFPGVDRLPASNSGEEVLGLNPNAMTSGVDA